MRGPVLALLVSLALPAGAGAAWFGGETLDGPSPAVRAIGGLDLAHDGAGALVYLRDDGAVLTRKVAGVWRAGELAGPGASEAAVTVVDGYRLALAYVAGGDVYGRVAPAGAGPQPLTAPVLLYDAPAMAPASGVAIAMGFNGDAYAVYASGGDVRAARLDGTTWTGLDAPLDVLAARGADQPRVAVGADGNAIVVWREDGRIYERRLIGLRQSAFPQEVSAAGVAADSPRIDVEDDTSFAWVAYRQGTSTWVRRLAGTTFDPPLEIAPGSSAPDVAMTGRGVGLAAAVRDDATVVSGPLKDSAFGPATRLDVTGAAGALAVAVAESREAGVVWQRAGAITGRRLGRDGAAEAETPLSIADAGEAGPPLAAADEPGDVVVAFTQGGDLSRRVVVAEFDDPPGRPGLLSTESWRPERRRSLVWRPGAEAWGAVTYAVVLDGVEIARTGEDRVLSPAELPDGEHSWLVRAVDRRGQVTDSAPRALRVDGTRPAARLRVRRTGRVVRVRVIATDPASGVEKVSIDFGDDSRRVRRRRAVHRYAERGAFRVTARVLDEAGNRRRVRKRVRIG